MRNWRESSCRPSMFPKHSERSWHESEQRGRGYAMWAGYTVIVSISDCNLWYGESTSLSNGSTTRVS